MRYDETYKEPVKNLAPIEHDGGFMVRAVSNVYAVTTGDTKASVLGMTNTGDALRNTSNALRLQVAYKHLETGGILSGVAYETGTTGESYIPDAAIIIDEIGR